MIQGRLISHIFQFVLSALFLGLTSTVDAAISDSVTLTGKITKFDAKTVSLVSGKRSYTFQKSRLGYPSYKVGHSLRIKLNRQELEKLGKDKK